MTENSKNKVPGNIVYELAIETAKILFYKQEQLKKITWTDGESNLDTEYSQLACMSCVSAWDNIIKKKHSIYDNVLIICEKPDINITFVYSDRQISKAKIELKSSKSKKIPGSTIKKLDINQPLIYCLRPSTNNCLYIIKCSQYHSAMGESDIDLFQDRTPRPFINFEKMNNFNNYLPFENKEKDAWIPHYAECGLNRIDGRTLKKKSWQDELVKQILRGFVKNTSVEEFIQLKEKYSKD